VIRRFTAFILLLFTPWGLQPNGVIASDRPEFCDLALVLAMDASSSVDSNEYRLQVSGMAAALLNPNVQQAIFDIGGIYILVFEWNGRRNQTIMLDWAWLASEQSIFEAARILSDHQRTSRNFPTALGHSMGFASLRFRDAPVACNRKVIDISGDGPNNDGYPPSSAFKAFDFSKITINGLVVRSAGEWPNREEQETERHYRSQVLHGPGAFLVVADGFEDFEHAMTQKLLKEIQPRAVGVLTPPHKGNYLTAR